MKTKTVFISGQVSGISYIAAYNHFRNAEYALLHYEKEEVNTSTPRICVRAVGHGGFAW